ncbi:MAG: PaaI family thioesterase [Rhodobacteraceae bacterium]|nr:PaaI family thioesterase [Paracoccaceae bacterium]
MTGTALPFDRARLIALSGLDYLHATLAGEIAAPPIWGLMGITLLRVAPGHVVFRAIPGAEHGNATGTIHGGWYGTLLDAAMGCAVMTTVPAGANHATLEYKINITRVVRPGQEVEAVGRVQHGGRRTGVASGEINGVSDGKLYATGSTTCIVLPADG